jgi:membrane-anchored glycerophosphoryl diester phosphodiesterase (GDPDase)
MIGVDNHCVDSSLLTNIHTLPMMLEVFQEVFSSWMESFQRVHKNQITLNLEVPLVTREMVCSGPTIVKAMTGTAIYMTKAQIPNWIQD